MPLATDVGPGTDPESSAVRISIRSFVNGVPRETVVDEAFLSSPEVVDLRTLRSKVIGVAEAPYAIRKGEEGELIPCPRLTDVLNHVRTEGSRGSSIQRYKGLGEMNPDQLWETTMDPEVRHLLQVRIDDIVATDEIFSVLMGDDVEPRRRFIQDNALNVSNLDI